MTEFLSVLGVAPYLGRDFAEGEGTRGSPEEVVILTFGFWERALGGDASVLGTDILLSGRPTTVIGVLPPDFEFPAEEVDLLLPMTISPTASGGRSSHWLSAVGRLRGDLTLAAATGEIDALLERWQVEHTERHQLGPNHPVRLSGVREATAGDSRGPLLILLGSVALVLLVACLNIANLVLVRSVGRLRAMGVRTALGAGRGALFRQLLIENLVVAALGGALGLILAWLAVDLIPQLAAGSLPPNTAASIDPGVLLFSSTVTLGAGLAFGLLPAWMTSGANIGEILRSGGPGKSAGRATVALRRGLVVTEVAAAVALIAAAGVLGRSFGKLTSVEMGFEPERAVVMDFSLGSTGYPEITDVARFHRSLRERLDAMPGVEAAGLLRTLPLRGRGGWETLHLVDADPDAETSTFTLGYQLASPAAFEALGVPLLQGRGFTQADDRASPAVAVVNQAAADAYFPTGAIGARVKHGPFGPDNPNAELTVVGVVGDVRQTSLTEEAPTPQLYIPYAQADGVYGGLGARRTTLVIRSTLPSGETLASARAIVQELDGDLPVMEMRSLEAHVVRSVGDRRFVTLLMSGFSLVALLLGVIGLHGLLRHSVQRRTWEIGLRLALGAAPGSVVQRVVSEAMALVVVGAFLGVLVALALGGILDGLVYGVSPRDPVALGGSAGVLLVAALLAALAPARRAAGVDPRTALRAE